MLTPAAPASYRSAPASGAPSVSRDWLATFGSRELAGLGAQAIEANYDLEAAAARVAQADALAGVAASALYPQLSASADAARSLNPGTLRRRDGPFEASLGNRFGAGLSASYVLDFWGRNRAGAQAAAQTALASRFDYETLSVATLASLANAYFQLAVAQDRLALLRDNVRIAERVLAAIRARVEVGTANALDLAQQESVLANLRANAPGYEQQAEQARNLVALVAGQAPRAREVRGAPLRSLALPAVRAGLPSQLLFRRPDVAAAEARLESAKANVAAARAAFLPTIALTSGGGLESAALRNLLRPEALALSLAAGLTQPIFDGYNLEAQLANQRARRDELLAAYARAIASALTDVENALVAVRKSAETERLRAVAVAAARRAYDITQERLREGTVDIVILLNTQTTLFAAQDAAALARYQRLLAQVSLYQALGGGFERAPAAIVEAAQ
ncbi:MAG: hypothetical protein JWN93_801 [Hyphomicrobiales bacterium]|nr:hypothetical protein [Hyphomicrobiales bacterium]